ncbi:hypothetical protein DM02DRAFT_419057 [Periconia macrospinosa]|uniref:Lysine-specific metallo-endopeptidase domain-containing protein n=1 Tax=Periconia macrospinosa TaxID=97972 RepID=A0A2V1CYU3_9PLEO|nr:hypothetical protein DM02DRAFT_419057 [Periconia macrospinosa]
MYTSIILLCALHFASIWATPVSSPEVLVPREFKEQRMDYKFSDLTNEFKGIDWRMVFRTEDCNDTQLDRIIKVTRNAASMLGVVDKATNGVLEYSEAWKAYFGFDLVAWQSSQTLRNQSIQLQRNIQLASKYAKAGRGGVKGEKVRTKVTFTCQYQSSCFKNAGAVAVRPRATHDLQGRIVFCPPFFDKKTKTLDDVLKTPKLASEVFEMNKLAERILIHEFMHVEKFGFAEHIGDVTAKLHENDRTIVPVYGESRCYEYARRYDRKPNPDVILNADNYAWFLLVSQVRAKRRGNWLVYFIDVCACLPELSARN